MPRPRHVAQVKVTLPRPRRRYGGMVGSLLFHLLVILLLYHVINGDFATVIERGSPLTPERGGGGGGGGGEFVALPALPRPVAKPVPPPVEQHPEPIVTPTVPVTVPENIPPPVDSVPKASVDSTTAGNSGASSGTGPGTGGGTGGGTGTGNGPGNGAGTGPGNGGGAGGKGRRPEPKRQVFPPMESAPKELRGRSVSVTFWVGVDGKVLRFEISPPIEDRGYAKKFGDVMREQEFKPARGPDGFPIPDTLTQIWKF